MSSKSQEKTKKRALEKVFEEIIAQYFLNLVKPYQTYVPTISKY